MQYEMNERYWPAHSQRKESVARYSRKREFMIVTMKEKVELHPAIYRKERVISQTVHEETRA